MAAESSEPVLLTKRATKGAGANAVPGVCMITRTRVRWQPDNPSQAKGVAIELGCITRQQQAPGKPFYKLETTATPLVLGFQTVADKDEAVELIKQLKPPAAPANGGAEGGGKGSSPGGSKVVIPTSQERQGLFQHDRDLGTLYEELVVSGILSEHDFWRTRQDVARRARGTAAARPAAPRQRVGMPNDMLADVRPTADGQTEKLQLSLSPQTIQQIFTERPEVHRAYLAHVPHAMTEEAFWARYFKLQYKRMAKRRKAGGAAGGANDGEVEDELFAPFKKQLEEQERRRAKQKMTLVDPSVNVAADTGDQLSRGFGLVHSGREELEGAGSLRRNRDSLAREFNRHAACVLEGVPEVVGQADGGEGGTAQIAAQLAAQLAAQQAAATEGGGEEEAVPEERRREWQQRAAPALEDLTLQDEGEQQAGPAPDPFASFAGGSDGAADVKGGEADAATVLRSVQAGLANIDPTNLPNPPCDPALAAQALLEVSQDEDVGLVREFGPVAAAVLSKPPSSAVPAVLMDVLRAQALKTNELLRHFWACMPATSPARRQRADKLAGHLRAEKVSLRAHMQVAPGTAQQVYVSLILRPLAAAVEAALARHEQEQQRQGGGPPG